MTVSEDAFNLLFTGNPLPMWMYEESSLKFLEVNDAALTAYGYSRDEFLGMTLRDIRPPDEAPKLNASPQVGQAPFRQVGIWKHRRKDGSLLDVQISVYSLRYQDRNVALTLALDMTEQTQASTQLQRNTDQALCLVEASQAFAETTDEDHLMGLLFGFARRLAPLHHWWRNRYDIGTGAGVTTHWTESLLALFSVEGITVPIQENSGHFDLNRRLKTERRTIHIPLCSESLHYHQPEVDAHPLQTYLAIPMVHQDQIVGSLIGGNFGADGPVDLEPSQIQSLETLVAAAALAILRVRALENLKVSERRYRLLFERNMAGVFHTTPSGTILDCNDAFAHMLGYTREELLSISASALYFERSDRQDYLRDLQRQGSINNLETKLRKKDGQVFWGLECVSILVSESGAPLIEGTLIDITARKRAEAFDVGQRELLAMVAQNLPIQLIMEDLVALAESQCPDLMCSVRLLQDGLLIVAASGHLPTDFAQALNGPLAEPGCGSCGGAALRGELVICPDLSTDPRWESHREMAQVEGIKAAWSQPILSGKGEVLGTCAFHAREAREPRPDELALLDTCCRLGGLAIEHQTLTNQLAHQAHHDALTGLPNRVLFHDRLQQSIAQATRHGQELALLFIDLDGFKHVNDTFGHGAGDILLKQVAERFSSVIRSSDTLARMGGDEFTVALNHLTDPNGAVRVARQLLDSLKVHIFADGHEIQVGASIGIAFFPGDAQDADTLQQHADAAMYRAKSMGRNNYQCFTAELQTRLQERAELENRLSAALLEGEFALHYQPMFTAEGRVTCFEALVRWNHPKLGLVPPAKFISTCEESGFIVPFGTWILERACDQIAAWRQAGHTDLRVAVNVSPLQFAQADWVDTIALALASRGLDPSCLELEITEGLIMDRPADAAKWLKELRALGVRIAIDDFGTGYSSLSYLQKLPIDTLKIDQSFVAGLFASEGSKGSATIVQTIVTLARNLGMEVVAEGVETEGQRVFLEGLGCNALQGFLLGRPALPEYWNPLLGARAK